ncbi:MAG: 16S rRNA (guanine(527)-N(7))-methyltransferase RsmG [Bacteroidales bacterium]|nr:16S rRNA (guanine(527)-N(7))-methyltransferase RsmG [Bacteroidales bacterium]
MEQLIKYFPNLTDLQKQQYESLPSLYAEWNEKINVISRKDIDNLYERHVVHSLGIVKVMPFEDGATVLDVGTGGGFPGIPLAIMFPNVKFTLVDSIGKKIKVVNAVAEALQLTNVEAYQTRAEQVKKRFDFVVCRAVTDMNDFARWVQGKILPTNRHGLQNGILALKGGDLDNELKSFGNKVTVYPLSKYFDEEFYETKKVVHLTFQR